MTDKPKTLAERLADARAKARKKAHQDKLADRRAVSALNKARRQTRPPTGG